MAFRQTFRNLLVGRAYIESRLEYKSAMLRGNMVLISIWVSLTYILIDIANDIFSGLPFYVVVIISSITTLELNKKHRFLLANLLFLVTINLLIFIFASSDVYRTGIYNFFICISLSAFSLMGYRKIKYALLFTSLSLALFLLSYWGEFSVMKPMAYDEKAISLYFTINFFIAMITCVFIVWSLININHRSETELVGTTVELKKSREQNEMVVETVNAGIYEWHPRDQSMFVNATWKRLMGYKENELKSVTLAYCHDLVHPDDLARIPEMIRRHHDTRVPYFNELRMRKKTGDYNWFLDSGNTRFDEFGKPLVTIGSIIDINDRKLAEEKILLQNSLLVKANRELDQFVCSVSHDLRAPLSSIMGLTHVYDLSLDPAEKASIVKLIGDRANTLDDFIREILDYSRNARTELKIKRMCLLPMLDEVLAGLDHMAGLDRIRINTEVAADLEVVTDRDRIKVIVTNMITNSIKYSDPSKDSFINIRSTVQNNEWILSVEDNGIGIESEHLPKIFDMFFQAHAHAHGSGLGLYIATEAVQRLGGKITADSTAGKGTTFTLTIPVTDLA